MRFALTIVALLLTCLSLTATITATTDISSMSWNLTAVVLWLRGLMDGAA